MERRLLQQSGKGRVSAREMMNEPEQLNTIIAHIKLAFRVLPVSAYFGTGNGAELEDGVQGVLTHLIEKDVDLPKNGAELKREIQEIVRQYVTSHYVRKRSPESYRMYKRLAEILKDGSTFVHEGETYRLVSSPHPPEWGKKADLITLSEEIREKVSVRQRDNTKVGTHAENGESGQVVISNENLKALVVEVMQCVAVPLPLGWLSKLVLSRIPILDFVEGEMPNTDEGSGARVQDTRWRLHEVLAMHDAVIIARNIVSAIYPNPAKASKAISSVLAYFDYEGEVSPTNLRIAAELGISDTSVSNYVGAFKLGMVKALGSMAVPLSQGFVTEYLHPALITELKRTLATLSTSSPTARPPRPPLARP